MAMVKIGGQRFMLKNRFIALLIDYLIIWIYLIALAIVMSIIYYVFFDDVPVFNQLTSQLLAFFTTVFPITIVFAIMEFKPPYGTIGKRMRKVKIKYRYNSFGYSLLRNALKFLPWQIGHMGVIAAMYNDFSTIWFMAGNIGFILAIIYVLMVIFNKNHQHIPDIIAGATVVKFK